MFSTLYGTYFPFLNAFKMSSAISLNLDRSRILSSGNGIGRTSDCGGKGKFQTDFFPL